MADRSSSPAYQMLPRSARRVFAAIEAAIGDGSSASVTYTSFGSIITSDGSRYRNR